MSQDLTKLRKLFPLAKEITIANKALIVKPMVWVDFLNIIEDFSKVMSELGEDQDFDLTKFDEKKDLKKLIPVMNEVLNIFAEWLSVDSTWLKKHLTMKKTMELLNLFLEVNEWSEVKSLFLALKSKVQKEQKEEKEPNGKI